MEAIRDLPGETAILVRDLSCGGTAEFNPVWGRGCLDVYAAMAVAPERGVLPHRVFDCDKDAFTTETMYGTAGPEFAPTAPGMVLKS